MQLIPQDLSQILTNFCMDPIFDNPSSDNGFGFGPCLFFSWRFCEWPWTNSERVMWVPMRSNLLYSSNDILQWDRKLHAQKLWSSLNFLENRSPQMAQVHFFILVILCIFCFNYLIFDNCSFKNADEKEWKRVKKKETAITQI